MSTKNEPEEVEHTVKTGKTEGIPQGITRFTQYTSPIILAMLVSADKDMALAQCSPCL